MSSTRGPSLLLRVALALVLGSVLCSCGNLLDDGPLSCEDAADAYKAKLRALTKAPQACETRADCVVLTPAELQLHCANGTGAGACAAIVSASDAAEIRARVRDERDRLCDRVEPSCLVVTTCNKYDAIECFHNRCGFLFEGRPVVPDVTR